MIIYDQKNKQHYCNDFNLICSKCKNRIAGSVLVTIFESERKKVSTVYFCESCLTYHKNPISKYDIIDFNKYHSVIPNIKKIFLAILTDKFPRNNIIVIQAEQPQQLGSFRTVFEASHTTETEKRQGAVVNDFTKLAGRNSIHGAKVGVMPKDKPALNSSEDAKNFLLGMKNAKPIIPKLIENKTV